MDRKNSLYSVVSFQPFSSFSHCSLNLISSYEKGIFIVYGQTVSVLLPKCSVLCLDMSFAPWDAKTLN